jgi:hypothetical protein
MTDEDVDSFLFVAAHDFGRVTKGQPVETQVYEAWYSAQIWQRVSDAPLQT